MGVLINYHPRQRREASKGGREANKKCVQAQSSTATARRSSSHNASRTDASSLSSSCQTNSSSKPSILLTQYDDQITELKLSIDSLEKEQDFYFAKLRDIEILSLCPEIENLLVVAAVKKILFAMDDDASVVAEVQAMGPFTRKCQSI